MHLPFSSMYRLAVALTSLHLDGIVAQQDELPALQAYYAAVFSSVQAVTSYRTVRVSPPLSAHLVQPNGAKDLLFFLPVRALGTIQSLVLNCWHGSLELPELLPRLLSLRNLDISEWRNNWTADENTVVALCHAASRKLKNVYIGDSGLVTTIMRRLTEAGLHVKHSTLPEWSDNGSHLGGPASASLGRREGKAARQDERYETLWPLRTMWARLETQGQDAKVGILDTGVSIFHHSFAANVRAVRSFVPGRYAWLDGNGHGTHCAGVIAATHPSGEPLGVAPRAQLVFARVLDDNGAGDVAWIPPAINWAVDEGCNIISLSLGCGDTKELFDAVQRALHKGVIVVCAASNYGSLYRNSISYPARYGNVLCVGSHDTNGGVSRFSSVGREVDFLAPGEEIYSTWHTPPNSFYRETGTSMATPFVAGLAALIVSCNLLLPPESQHTLNCSVMRAVLRAMTTSPGYHTQERGHGVIEPMTVLRHGLKCLSEALYQL